MASREYGSNKYDLMGAYNAKNLGGFRDRAKEIQKEFVKMIEDNGVEIEEYDTVEQFIEKN